MDGLPTATKRLSNRTLTLKIFYICIKIQMKPVAWLYLEVAYENKLYEIFTLEWEEGFIQVESAILAPICP